MKFSLVVEACMLHDMIQEAVNEDPIWSELHNFHTRFVDSFIPPYFRDNNIFYDWFFNIFLSIVCCLDLKIVPTTEEVTKASDPGGTGMFGKNWFLLLGGKPDDVLMAVSEAGDN